MGICKYKAINFNDIPAMSDLLIQRQSIESKTFSFLENSCLNKIHIRNTLYNLLADNKAIGIGAFVNDELTGYILGEIKTDITYLRGRHIWVPYEGIAVRSDQSPEIIRDLYAKASVLWIKQGCFRHYVLLPIGNQAYYDAFKYLSFAIEQVHGIMNINNYKPFENTANVNVRLANKNDKEVLGMMSRIISSYQSLEPVFQPTTPELIKEIKKGYEDLVEDNNATVFIAEKDMRQLGFQVYDEVAPSLMTPDNVVELSVAGVDPSHMGGSIGKKLMNESCRIMKGRGYNSIMTDWRITNLASSTFWPKCGFKPVAYRMVRYIDINILWAEFNQLV